MRISGFEGMSGLRLFDAEQGKLQEGSKESIADLPRKGLSVEPYRKSIKS